MVDRSLPLCVILVATALAGCSDAGSRATADPDDLAVDGLDLAPTSTTGIIRGIVVDQAIRPLANATVQLAGDTPRNTTSNEAGAFGFAGLEPGTYFLHITKTGYTPVQQSADVVAGEPEPRIVKVVLAADATYAPFVETRQFDGYIECTTSIIVLCGIPNVLLEQNITNDRFAWDQYFADNASHLQAEMVWDSTQALSPDLYFELEALNDACESEDEDASSFLNNTEGGSPIYATVNATQVQTWKIGQACPIWVSVFSIGPVCSPPVPQDVPRLGGFSHCPGFTVAQRFTMYFHTFHGYMPPPGWRFAVDGAPPMPPA